MASRWAMKMHDEALEECEDINIDWTKTIYLSPDAELPLLDFEINSGGTSFILGGLIDRTRAKNATLNKVQNLDILELRCRRLPIQEFCDFKDDKKELIASKELCLDQVVKILNLFKYHKSRLNNDRSLSDIWEEVLAKILPERTKYKANARKNHIINEIEIKQK